MTTPLPHPRPRVLVVDDEPIAREIACSWFDELGYDTVCAESAAGALALLEDYRCDVLFTDIHLQDRPDGFQLSVAVVNRQPNIRSLFVSALAWGPHQSDEPGTTFLHKPYSKAELSRALGVVLED
jgi:CheY-like chemotaxis protein